MLSRIKILVNRIFRLEEINGRNLCPTYLYRWTLLRLFGCGVYLHKFVGDDWSRDMHDHPRRFISIGLWGSYIEETPGDAVGCWEVIADPPDSDPDWAMVRIRWSIPDSQGKYLWVRHYPADAWGVNACERQAEEFNASGRQPWEYGFVHQPPPVTKHYRAPWFRSFPAEHVHRIRLEPGTTCWTLVIVMRLSRPWGFWHLGRWIPFRDYVKSETAAAMKSCP